MSPEEETVELRLYNAELILGVGGPNKESLDAFNDVAQAALALSPPFVVGAARALLRMTELMSADRPSDVTPILELTITTLCDFPVGEEWQAERLALLGDALWRRYFNCLLSGCKDKEAHARDITDGVPYLIYKDVKRDDTDEDAKEDTEERTIIPAKAPFSVHHPARRHAGRRYLVHKAIRQQEVSVSA